MTETIENPVPTDEPAGTPTLLYVPGGDDPEPALSQLAPTVRRLLALDVETNALGLSDPDYQVRTIQLGSPTCAVILSATDPVHRAAVRRMLTTESASRGWLLTAHNASFDTQALVKIGVFTDLAEAWSRMVDTLVLATMIEPPMMDKDTPPAEKKYRSLKHQTATWCPSVARSQAALDDLTGLFKANKWQGTAQGFDAYKVEPEKNGWAQVDPADPVMVTYAASDVLDGASLAETLYPIVLGTRAASAASEHRLARIAAEMEMRGLRLDREFAQERLDEATEVQRTCESALADMGVLNPSKNSEVAAWLGTKPVQLLHGKASVKTDSSALAAYAAQDAEVAAMVPLLERWRLARKLDTSYFTPYLRQPADRIHPSISTAEAATGRMSISKPSVQNAPRKGGVRECFIADEGKVLVTADFSSVEMRVAGALAQDQGLYDVFAAGDDPYWVVARQVHGDEATKDQRDRCKRIALGRLYGQGVPGLAQTWGVTESEARTILDAFDAAYPALGKLRFRLKDGEFAQGVPCWTNLLGRHQRLDPTLHYKATNYLVQGLSRDVLVQAMFRAEDAGLGDALWVPIHDEIVLQAPEERAEEYRDRLVEVMSTTLLGWDIPAEGVVLGARWKKA